MAAMYKKDQRPTTTQFSRSRITPPPLPPVPATGYPLQDRQDVPVPLDPGPPDPLAGASSSISSSVSNSVSSSLSSSAIDELQAASSRFTGTLSTFSLISSAAVQSARDNGLQDGSASARASASSVIASATAQAAAVLSQASSISSSASLVLAAMTGGASAISSIQESASSAVDAAQSIASSSAQSAIDAAVASASAVMRSNMDGTQAGTSSISSGQLAGIIIGTAIASSVISALFTLLLIRYRRQKATEAEESTALNPNSRQPGRPVFSAGQDNVFEFPFYTTGIGYHQQTPSNNFAPEMKQVHSSTVKSRPVRISISARRPLPSVPSTIHSEPATPIPYPSEPNTPGRGLGEPGFGLGLYSSDTEHDPSSPITISTTSVRRDTRGDLAPMMKFSLTRKRSTGGGQRMQLVRVGNKKDSIHRLLSQEATPPNTGRRMNRYSKTQEEEHRGAEIDRETTASVAGTTGSGEGPQYQLPSLSDMSSLGLNPMKYGRSTESSPASSSTSSNTSVGKNNNQVPKREQPRPRSSPAAPGRRTTRASELFLHSIPPPPPPPPPPLPPQPPAQEHQKQQQPVSYFSPYSTPTRSSMSMSLPSSPPPPPLPPLRVPSLKAPIPRRPHITASVISLDQQLQVQSPPRSQARPRTAPKPGTGAAAAAAGGTAAPATFSLFPRD
ncbi:hypothetical protein F4809DRAFT_548273 [Biscogniauxia mediterranea]|nr:hypothetical protein F4809DRAFT_548273 [Biscogniauxia mediterranea]